LDVSETIDTSNTITDGEDTASFLDVAAEVGSSYPALEDSRDL
jgi:hypothetical protein